MIRRSILLILLALVVSAFTASVAIAANFRGTAGNDTIRGTAQADIIKGFAGFDTLSGLGGNDTINAGPGNDTANGGDGSDIIYGVGGDDELFGQRGGDKLYGGDSNDTLRGQAGADRLVGNEGNDTIIGNTGVDSMFGGPGNDFIAARGDGVDRIFCGPGFDVANVSLNDLVGGTSVEEILGSVTSADQAALSCEVLIVDGLRVPLGAIVDLPAGLEADVSLLLEEFLRDGELSPDEIADLEEVFDLIDQGLLEELGRLLDDLLGGLLG